MDQHARATHKASPLVSLTSLVACHAGLCALASRAINNGAQFHLRIQQSLLIVGGLVRSPCLQFSLENAALTYQHSQGKPLLDTDQGQ